MTTINPRWTSPPTAPSTSSAEDPWRAPIRLGVVTILVSALAFAGWASLAPVSGAIVAMGQVKPERNRKPVQHTDGGIVREILVKEGAQVASGQALMSLDNVGVDANLQLLRELAAAETVKRERLDREQQLAPQFSLAQVKDEATATAGTSKSLNALDNNQLQAAYSRELKVFQARRHSLDQQLETLQAQLNALAQERKALLAQIQADEASIKLAQEQLNMNRSLEQQKYVARTHVLDLERALADYQARLGEHQATLAQSEQRGHDLRLRMASARNEYQRAATEEYKESSNRLAEIRERLRPAADAMTRQTVVAPVAGSIVGVRVHSAGQVVGPRDVLMEIVPDGEALIVEAQVSVDGIHDVQIGQAANLRFTAYKSRTTPVVEGTVTHVAADTVTDKNGIPFYLVHVRPEPKSLQAAGITQVQPGMAVETYLLTQARSTLDYLLAPIAQSLRQSMRER